MNQQEFNILLQKYLSGTCDEEETALIIAWHKSIEEKKDFLSPNESEEIKKRIFNRLKKKLFNHMDISILSVKTLGAVAAIALFLASSFYFISHTGLNALPFTAQSGIEMKNTSGSDKKLTLEDGSIVTLEPNSSISYPEHFGKEIREVYLRGEAFFSVKKNPNKPFIVHAGEVTTEVLGTSFRIKSYENNPTIEVAVVTGRVSVFKNSSKAEKSRDGVVLTPNQQVKFNRITKEIIPSIVEEPKAIAHLPNNLMIFEDEAIENILSKLTKEYGIEIFVEKQVLNKCVFTGDLNGLSLTTQLDLICKAIGSKFEQRGTSIFILGGGCF